MSTDYFLAKSLVAFRNSVDKQFPNRDKTSDGWIGDASHAARQSDHNPCWTCASPYRGIVRAIDVDIDGRNPNRNLREEILKSTIRHPAVWYVISNGKIYSRTHNWVANDYTGTNGHFHHVHISINHDVASYNDTSLVLKPVQQPKPPEVDMPLNQADKDFITGEVQRFSAFNADNLRQNIRNIASAVKAAVDPTTTAGVDEVMAELAKLEAQLPPKPPVA